MPVSVGSYTVPTLDELQQVARKLDRLSSDLENVRSLVRTVDQRSIESAKLVEQHRGQIQALANRARALEQAVEHLQDNLKAIAEQTDQAVVLLSKSNASMTQGQQALAAINDMVKVQIEKEKQHQQEVAEQLENMLDAQRLLSEALDCAFTDWRKAMAELQELETRSTRTLAQTLDDVGRSLLQTQATLESGFHSLYDAVAGFTSAKRERMQEEKGAFADLAETEEQFQQCLDAVLQAASGLADTTARINMEQEDVLDDAARHHSTLLLNEAARFFRRGDWATAAMLWEAVLKDYPDHPDALLGMGMVHLHGGQMEAAVHALHRAAELTPNRADVWHMLGLAALIAHDYDGALQALNRALDRDPQNASLWLARGRAWYGLGQVKQAVEDWLRAKSLDAKAVELDPDVCFYLQDAEVVDAHATP